MTNIVSFLKKVDEHSLGTVSMSWAPERILRKELPWPLSILSYLHERGIRTMATTHYSELKVYALSTPRCGKCLLRI